MWSEQSAGDQRWRDIRRQRQQLVQREQQRRSGLQNQLSDRRGRNVPQRLRKQSAELHVHISEVTRSL
jgi:hypothetical protein